MKKIPQSDYQSFVKEIKEKIFHAQLNAMQAVNHELLSLYTDIGKSIVEKQENLGWGKSVVENLSHDLHKEFPGIKGFSVDNLWRMRKFYLTYKENGKLAPLVQEIGWSHNIIILEKCQDALEKEFYIRMTKKYGWTKSILIHQIEGKSYERYLVNQTNFDETSLQNTGIKRNCQSKTVTILIFLNWAENMMRENWNWVCSRISGAFCWKWVGIFHLSQINISWILMVKTSLLTCCYTIGV